MKIVLVRAHDSFDDHSEVSVEQQVEAYLKFLRSLLSQVADNTDASWWLLDSGASTSVLAESNLSAFRSVLQDSEGLGGYRAANGSSVNMSGTAEIGVQMHMSGPSGDDWCWNTTFCQLLHWQIRDGDSHKVQKVLICFTKGLECIVLTLPILPIVLWVRLYPDVGTGEDRLWESKFYIPFQPQKWASNKSNSSVTSSCASCGFLRSRLESQSWNSFNSFPIVNGVPAGVPTPPDSGKTPQLKTKLAQNCGKTEVLHLQPSYGICWSHEIETLPPM